MRVRLPPKRFCGAHFVSPVDCLLLAACSGSFRARYRKLRPSSHGFRPWRHSPDCAPAGHAAGEQVGLVYVPWSAALEFHTFDEFSATARLQVAVYGITVYIKFYKGARMSSISLSKGRDCAEKNLQGQA